MYKDQEIAFGVLDDRGVVIFGWKNQPAISDNEFIQKIASKAEPGMHIWSGSISINNEEQTFEGQLKAMSQKEMMRFGMVEQALKINR